MSNANDFVIENGVLREYIGEAEVVIVPEGVVEIGVKAFADIECIINVVLPNGVESIGERAFWGCVCLSDINFPDSLRSIGDYAFSGCESLESFVPDYIENIGKGAFCCCNALADENGFVVIRGILYNYCGDSYDAVIPKGTTQIEEEEFFYGRGT